MSTFKKGDVVGYIFAQPGNDRTFLILTDVRVDDASAWDVSFDLELKSVPLSCLWMASECELESKICFITKTRKGSFTIQQLVDDAKLLLGAAELKKV